MSAQTSLARVVGTPTINAWSQVHKFTPADPGKIQSRGELFAALSFKQANLPSVDLGHEILTRLNEEFFGPDDAKGSPFELLKSAVSTVGQEFGEVESLEIITAVVWNDLVYFCVFGNGKVLLWRGGKLVNLLGGPLSGPIAPLSGEEEVAVVSGQYKEGDVFVLATSAFSQIVNQTTLVGLFSQYEKISDVADIITPLAHQSSLPTVAGAFIRVSGNQVIGQSGNLVTRTPESPVIRTPGKPTPRTSFFKTFLIRLAEKLPEEVDTKTYHISGSGRKTAVSVGILLILLFVLSIAFGLKQKNEHEYRLSYQDQLVQAENSYNESLLQKDVDMAHARQLFLEAKQTTDELASRGIKDDKLEKLRAQIAADAGSILGEVQGEAVVFLDLSLVRSGITASQIAIHGESLAILDSAGQRIISTSQDKETVVIGGPEKLNSPHSVAVYADRYFSLGGEGVVELDKRGAVGATIKPDGWGDVSQIGVFGGNLYLLDKGPNEIWRYAGVGGEFAEKQRWLGSGVAPDFSDFRDMTIDGSIWILHEGGEVVRYTKGSPQIIAIRGFEGSLSSISAIYTDEEQENVYLLDSGGSRIIELSKTGSYQKQYLAGEIAGAVDFVVSKSAGKIFLLTRDKVLELDL